MTFLYSLYTLQILHTSIDHIEHRAVTTNAVVYLKDFRRFLFEYQTPEDCQDMVDALEILSKPSMSIFSKSEQLCLLGRFLRRRCACMRTSVCVSRVPHCWAAVLVT